MTINQHHQDMGYLSLEAISIIRIAVLLVFFGMVMITLLMALAPI